MIEAKPFVEPQIIAVPKPLVIKQLPAHPSNYSHETRVPTLICLHATGGHEGLNKDTDEATEISKPLPEGKEKSFHFAVDANSVTQSVDEKFVAWHAKRAVNPIAIGIEMCGSADQTREQWFDEISLATMQYTARLCAELCAKWKIPVKLVRPEELVLRIPGITTHAFVTEAFKQSTHYDPGPGFPIEAFIDAVKRAM